MKYILFAAVALIFSLKSNAINISEVPDILVSFHITSDTDVKNGNSMFLLFSDGTVIIKNTGKTTSGKLTEKELNKEIESSKLLFNYKDVERVGSWNTDIYNKLEVSFNGKNKNIVMFGDVSKKYYKHLEDKIKFNESAFSSRFTKKEIKERSNEMRERHTLPDGLLDLFLHYKNYSIIKK
jgi:hypothetical protein